MSLHAALFAAGKSVAEATARFLGDREAAQTEFPFLAEFFADPPASEPIPAFDRLFAAAALGPTARDLFLTLALVDEDARFGVLFEAIQASPGQHRPTLGMLARLLPGARGAAHTLVAAGLVRPLNPDAPRAETVLEVPGALWDALTDQLAPLWARLTPNARLVRLAELHLDPELHTTLARLPTTPTTLVVRGPRHNGRETLLGAVASAHDWSSLVVELPPDDPRLALAGPLATALDALLILRFDPGPGATVRLDLPRAYDRHLGVVLPRSGGLDGEVARRTLTLRRDMPGLALRTAQWTRVLPAAAAAAAAVATFARTFRLTSGGIARVAGLARAAADLRGEAVVLGDVREATRTLHRESLDQLASPLAPGGHWNDVVVADDVAQDLRHLELRCRCRETLPAAVGPALRRLSPGVRALFAGPSGTGKTLAARTLAGVLGMDLYRVDLGAVVNKYIGETEKNLERLFSRAEELDDVLLLDEGDALMSRRTAVSSATDRYANLETNFLLQRLEDFTGIVLVTTNAADRIDPAFARRIDVVVEFRAPELAERMALWRMHLPEHAIPAFVLDEVVELCRLTGAQIRNAAIHAALLAHAADRSIGAADLRAAVDREYRKQGAPLPLGDRQRTHAALTPHGGP